MYGFWYCRYRYIRSSDGVFLDSDIIGHKVDTNDFLLWENMRDFMADATVTWKRDKLPRVTKMAYSVNNNPGDLGPEHFDEAEGDQQMVTLQNNAGEITQFPRSATTIHDARLTRTEGLFASDAARSYERMTTGQQTKQVHAAPMTTTYEVSYSNMPVTWNIKYSARKHLMDTNLYRNGIWQSMTPDSIFGPERLPEEKDFLVKFGYVAFDASGTLCFTTPIDRIHLRSVEAEIQYFVTLRDPIVDPWTKPVNIDYPEPPAVEGRTLLMEKETEEEELPHEDEIDDLLSDDLTTDDEIDVDE